jgi:2-polyprenyl-3-methyl-5-hydroxy-6-metoxy-1,4-benzoquinol methylase
MSLYSFLTNNILLNNLLIFLKLDAKKELSAGHWKAFKYNASKSIQQNAGFSHTEEVEDSLRIVKTKLIETLSKNVAHKGKILDIGCGPGIYMDLLKDNYTVTGIDISEAMLNSASHLLPNNKLYKGNFLSIPFTEPFDAIYSISVLEYIPVSRIDDFFKKCADLLNKTGIIFIQYPHALKRSDLFYPDRNYICYSPDMIGKIAARYFKIIQNNQSYDGRESCVFDNKPYPTLTKTFKNGYLLIASKS